MDHKADVAFVDSHAECIGRYHHLQAVIKKFFLEKGALFF